MAQLLLSYPSSSATLRCANYFRSRSAFGKAESWGRSLQMVQCCSTTNTSSSSKLAELLGGREVVKGRENSNNSEEFECLVSEFGWKARRLAKEDDEMRKVAAIQAEAFHIPVLFFDDVFFEFFKAEVLSGLLYKLRNSPPNRYACLVAEPNNEAIKSQNKLVGVVDVTVLRDEDVLQRLHGAEEYLYVSGLAVSKTFRRRKIGSVLLKACDMLAIVWGFKYLALRAYEEDYGARKLYSKSGYEVASGDPPWMSTWIGRKRRVLMIKRVNNFA
ncbi:hypothetical protein Pint_07375 [Pistacia integerrima]|uniref:Uncharacterized protein n=1 Tax=Pistacia integerrima TaxID=434235 RepID=A0ACC0Y160_9ROSI|nr:hypothetical protein Pint_07375 [Pistacia integerrima]